MAEYNKTEIMAGNWVKGKDVKSGSKAKLKSEVHPTQSQFKDKDGNAQMQDVGKIHIQGDVEQKNIRVNKASISALVDAFGKDSKDWIDKVLTIETMKVSVGGKMQTAVYLIPEGYELGEDANGYVVITSVSGGKLAGDSIEYPDEDIDESEIPF